MAYEFKTHLEDPEPKHRTRKSLCGKSLGRLLSTTKIAEVTCEFCLNLERYGTNNHHQADGSYGN